MITVEELIVQSLYHRLVLITVRRTPNYDGNKSGDTELGAKKDENSGSSAEILPVTNEQHGSSSLQGLGYLFLGPAQSLPSDGVSTDAGVLEKESEPLATVTLDEQLSNAEALIRSLTTEEVSVRSRICNVINASDINIIQRFLRTTEVQTDFEPMWCVERNSFAFSSSESGSKMSPLPSSALNYCSGPLIDLRTCNQFSLIHMEDLQDPESQSLVMVSTNENGATRENTKFDLEKSKAKLRKAAGDSSAFFESSTPIHNLSANSERLSSQGALFVEDSSGHLKREFLPVSDVVVHSGAQRGNTYQEVDSGIWDMMQALESSGNAQILSENETDFAAMPLHLTQRQIISKEKSVDSSSDLKGTYKMFHLGDQPTNGSFSEIKESSFDSYCNEDRVEKRTIPSEGGLSDALKPITAVNFVVHRVETDAIQHETIDGATSSDKSSRKDKSTKRSRAGAVKNFDRSFRRARSLKVRKPSRNVCHTCHRCGSRTKEGEGYKLDNGVQQSEGTGQSGATDGRLLKLCHDIQSFAHDASEPHEPECPCSNTVHHKKRFADDEELEAEQEHYEDVIKVTSLEIAHSRFSTGSTQNLTELGRHCHPWEIVVPPRKSQSERSSPMSSLTDIRSLCHQHTKKKFEKNPLLAGGANVAQTRRSLPLSSPLNDASSQRFATTETPNTPLSNDLMGSTPEWGSEQWSAGTTDSLSIMNIACDQDILQFEKFPDWMRKLPVELHTVPLSGICIPGSHIALAIEKDMKTEWDFSRCNYEMADFLRKLPNLPVFNNFRDHMKSIWKAWMPKQWLNIHDQLVAGSRYFDLRITKHNDIIYGEHGLYTRQLKKYLKEIRLFMEEQTFEVVILHFQSCDYLDRSDKRHLVTMLFQIFGGKMVCKSEGSLPSLEWMWSMKKQLLILFPENDMDLIKNHIFGGLVWSDEVVDVTTPKKQTVSQLVEYLEDLVPKRLATRDTSKLFVCKAVLSPDMSTVFGKFHYQCMRELVSCEIASAVNSWLKSQSRMNIVAVDFIGVGGTVEKILELNKK